MWLCLTSNLIRIIYIAQTEFSYYTLENSNVWTRKLLKNDLSLKGINLKKDLKKIIRNKLKNWKKENEKKQASKDDLNWKSKKFSLNLIFLWN